MNKVRQSVCLLLPLGDELTDPGESDMSPLPDPVNPAPSGLAFWRKSLNRDASYHKEKHYTSSVGFLKSQNKSKESTLLTNGLL